LLPPFFSAQLNCNLIIWYSWCTLWKGKKVNVSENTWRVCEYL
jgi:hypothetical protein